MNQTDKALTLAGMSLGYGVVQLDVTIVNTALNAIGGGAGGGVSALQWVVNSYTVGFASLILTAGALGDRVGANLSLGLLTTAIIEGGRTGWANALAIAGLIGGIGVAALFVLRENKAEQPMLPLGLFSERLFSLASAIGVLVNIAFYGLIFVLSLYFQELNGWPPFETGLAFVPMLGIVLPVNILAPRLSERIGQPWVIAVGAGVAGAGALALLLIAQGTSYWAMWIQLLALGGGLGLLVPPMTSMLLGSVNKRYSGIASGVLNSARQTGSVIGVALFGAFVANKDSFLLGAHLALIISGLLLFGAAALALLGRSVRPAPPATKDRGRTLKRETVPLARATQ
jgi:DHA2 family methylenomycin A resistance protein-like MFS transporter